jgi:hypothetical protein
VLVHVDTELAGGHQRFTYVSVSRGRYEAKVYTDDGARIVRTAVARRIPSRGARAVDVTLTVRTDEHPG